MITLTKQKGAPKKTAEGLATVQKGTGEKPSVGLDTISTQQALSMFFVPFISMFLASLIISVSENEAQ